MRTRRTATALIAVVALAACGPATPDAPDAIDPPPADVHDVEPVPSADDAADELGSGPPDDPEPEPAEPEEPESIAAALDPFSTSALQAIDTAERHARGGAYAVERDGDRWEVAVLAGDRTVEVEVDLTGATVLDTDRGKRLKKDRREAMDLAVISLAAAVERAVVSSGGYLDEAGLAKDDGVFHWEVTVVVDDDDEDFLVDLLDGTVIRD